MEVTVSQRVMLLLLLNPMIPSPEQRGHGKQRPLSPSLPFIRIGH